MRRPPLVLLVLVGCAAPPTLSPVDARSAPDAGPEADAGTAADAGRGLVFRLRLVSDVPESVYLQASGMSGDPEWIGVRDASGAALAMFQPCELCACTECLRCGVCGMARPVVAEVVANSAYDLAWDARVFPRGNCGASTSCYRALDLAPGPYVARFCWADAVDGTGPGHQVTGVTCADVPFVFPVAGGVVSHLVDHGG